MRTLVASLVASVTALVALSAAEPGTTVRLCGAGDLRFLEAELQPINSVLTGYQVSLRNRGRRACIVRRFMSVRVQRDAPTVVDIQPTISSSFMPHIPLSRPLRVAAGGTVGTYLTVTTYCDRSPGSDVAVALSFGLPAMASAPRLRLSIRACRLRGGAVEVPPLGNV